MDSTQLNMVKISLKTDARELKESVEKAVSSISSGYIDVNINTPMTWINLLFNHEIPISHNYIIKNDYGGYISSQLTDKISSYIGQFKKNRKVYNARIVAKTASKPPPPQKRSLVEHEDSVLAKRGRGRPKKVEPPASTATMPMPTPSRQAKAPSPKTNSPTPKLKNKDVESTAIPIPIENAVSVEDVAADVNRRTGSTNGLEEPHETWKNHPDARDETESLFSCFSQVPLASRPGIRPGLNQSKDVKASVIESMVKNVNNNMLWQIKAEYDKLNKDNLWLKVAFEIPVLANLVQEMFHDTHFS